MKRPSQKIWRNLFIFSALIFIQSNGYCLGNDDEPVLTIPKTHIAPIIDGELDYIWNFTTLQLLTHDVSAYFDDAQDCPGTPPDSLMDCNPGFRVLWDNKNLYFYFSVDDDTLIRENYSETFEDDNFELFLDSDFSHGTIYDGVNDLHVHFPWSSLVPSVSPFLNIDISKLDYIQRKSDTGWVMELAIPLSTLKIPAVVNPILGMDVHYDDDDGSGCLYNNAQYRTRNHKLCWWTRDCDDTWKNPGLMAKVMMGDEITFADIELSEPGYDFGDVKLDTTETVRFLIINPGYDTLKISEIGTGTDAYALDAYPDEVAPGGNMEITVRFSPAEPIDYTDSLTILSNACQNPACTFWLKGTGVYPHIEQVSVFPNPFTPNGDGYNDTVSFEYPEMVTDRPHVQIFNMHGSRVRDLSNFSGYETRWNGKDDQDRNLEPGVYLYILEVKNKVIGEGTITLIR